MFVGTTELLYDVGFFLFLKDNLHVSAHNASQPASQPLVATHLIRAGGGEPGWVFGKNVAEIKCDRTPLTTKHFSFT